MQNEPNFQKSQMNVSSYIKMDYEKRTLGERGKNEPKTNPIKADLQKAQMNVNKVLTKEYEKKLNWALYENEPKTKPIKPKKILPPGQSARWPLCGNGCQDKICNSLIDLALHCW